MDNTILERRKKAKEIMSRQGLTVKEWANKNGVSAHFVHAVIRNETPCNINKGHKVAVLLGLKKGKLPSKNP